MLDTSARLLRLLALLQARRDWSGVDLARRLEVTPRTVRRDVDRLRRLGYTVDARFGAGGGYQLGRGSALPPLLLDDEEAVALVVALRASATLGVAGMDDIALRALAKLDQLLPSRLQRRSRTIGDAVSTVAARGPQLDTDVLTAVAVAVRNRQQLRIDYRSHDGTSSRRTVEPHRIVHTGTRWYLLAWDLDRADWRTLRMDRLRVRIPTGPTFDPRPLPETDAVAFVLRSVQTSPYRYRCRVTVQASAAAIAEKFSVHAADIVSIDHDQCELTAGANSLDEAAFWLATLDADITVHEPRELRERLATLGQRFSNAR